MSTTLEGATNSSRSAQLGYLLSASALVWRRGPFAAGVEARLNTLQAPTQGTYQSAWSAGIAGRWDFVAASDQMKAERKE